MVAGRHGLQRPSRFLRMSASLATGSSKVLDSSWISLDDVFASLGAMSMQNEDEADTEYRYRELPSSNYIRVLKLQPSEDFFAPIKCDLRAIERNFSTAYTALSYSWADESGDASQCCKLSIGNKVMMITRNLSDALRRLREGNDLTVWADAVCINQSDVREKTIQVSEMASVYRNASRTLVWLGEPASDEVHAVCKAFLRCVVLGLKYSKFPPLATVLDTLEMEVELSNGEILEDVPRRMMEASADIGRDSRFWMDWLEETHDRTWIELLNNPRRIAVAEVVSRALNSMLACRYFTRMWVVQEIICSNSETTFCRFGGLHVSMIWLERLCHDDFRQNLHDLQQLSMIQPDEDTFDLYGAAGSVGTVLGTQMGSLPSAMMACETQKCSDPRDRVYALLSLDPSWELVPDYSRSIAETYKDFARTCVQRHPHLRWLLDNWKGRSLISTDLRLPSWVPDLRKGFRFPREYVESSEQSDEFKAELDARQRATLSSPDALSGDKYVAARLLNGLDCWLSGDDTLCFHAWYVGQITHLQTGTDKRTEGNGSHIKLRTDYSDHMSYFVKGMTLYVHSILPEPGDVVYVYHEIYYHPWEISPKFVKYTNKRYDGMILRPVPERHGTFRLLFTFDSFWWPNDEQTCTLMLKNREDREVIQLV